MNSFRTRVSVTILIAATGALILAGCSNSPESARAPATTSTTPLTSVPATAPVDSASAAQPEQPANAAPAKTLGPNGYGKLRFGMTEEQALATGEIVLNAPSQDGATCLGYDLKGYETPQEDWTVVISREHGLVAIFAKSGMHTTEGIGTGASFDKVKATYPNIREIANGHYSKIPGPGNEFLRYRFSFNEKRELTSFFVENTQQDCYE